MWNVEKTYFCVLVYNERRHLLLTFLTCLFDAYDLRFSHYLRYPATSHLERNSQNLDKLYYYFLTIKDLACIYMCKNTYLIITRVITETTISTLLLYLFLIETKYKYVLRN